MGLQPYIDRPSGSHSEREVRFGEVSNILPGGRAAISE
jgi:hypothetical protein